MRRGTVRILTADSMQMLQILPSAINSRHFGDFACRQCCLRRPTQARIIDVLANEGAKATKAEIIAYCRTHMSGFETPKAVVFGTIPRGSPRSAPRNWHARAGAFR